MKKIRLTLLLLGIGFSQLSHAQNYGVILAPKFYNGTLLTSLPVPTTASGNLATPTNSPFDPFSYVTDGYDGQRATGAQNIILDNSGEILFFVVDEGVYDKKGKSLGVINDPNATFIQGVVSELVIIPIPGDCDSYYLISTVEGLGVTVAYPYYCKLNIKYDGNDDQIAGSGLEYVGTPEYTAKRIQPLVGSIYYGTNNVHDERPVFAVTPEANNQRFIFMNNGSRFFRLKATQTALTYDNYFLDLNTLGSDYRITDATSDRQEMEAIPLANGDYRVAVPVDAPNFGLLQNAFTGVFVMDFNPTGSYISGSLKQIKYDNQTAQNGYDSKVYISGIELSPDGQRLYITHNEAGVFQSSLDYFVLNQSVPTRNIITVTGVNDFQQSHIEAFPDGSIIIPATTRLAKINNANSPVFPTDYLFTFQPLANYTANAPFPIPQLGEALRLLQDNIDGMDYANITNVYFDRFDYNASATTDVLWEPNAGGTQNNPLVASTNATTTIYIEHELRIPAGKNITIKNMIFKFAPDAKVIIERGNGTNIPGGKLTLDHSTFSVDDRCKDEMWQGVEVWGYLNKSQIYPGNTQQGTFVVTSGIVEHAYVGALASKRIGLGIGNLDPAYSGGIIRSTNSTFFNNQIGVYVNTYNVVAGYNFNKCYFENTDFFWDAPLKKEGVLFLNQVQLVNVYGILFRGNTFQNSTPDLLENVNFYLKGQGINALNSTFRVLPRCVNAQCTVIDENRFNNLSQGVFVNNGNLYTFEIDRAVFTNCITGTNSRLALNPKINRNTYKVHEGLTQTAGIILFASTGYQVSENTFNNHTNTVPASGTKAYGIMVINSGQAHNEIYKNDFKNLKIGGQAQGTNATQAQGAGSTGLQWKCNRFFNTIVEADLALIQGRIDYNQGYFGGTTLQNATSRAARNQFSMIGETIPEHDLKSDLFATTQTYQYVHLSDPNQVPDRYTLTKVFPLVQTFNGLPVYQNGISVTNACPTLFSGPSTVGGLGGTIELTQGEINRLKNQIDGGSTENLVNTVNSSTNTNSLLPTLIQDSPYLSDEVLEAYISKNPNKGQLKQILVSNSPLSQHINDLVATVEMPIGTRNQINNAQVGVSQRELLYQDISYNEDLLANTENELHHIMQMDTIGIDSLIVTLERSNKLDHRKNLLDLYIQKGDHVKESALRSELQSKGVSDEFLEVMQIQRTLHDYSSEQEAVTAEPVLLEQLQNLRENAVDELVKAKAINTIAILEREVIIEPFLEFSNDKSMNQAVENNSVPYENKVNYVTIYPNPASGKVNLDFQNIPDGKMDVQFVDLTGKVVFETSFENTNGETIDISSVHNGLYLVKIIIDKQVVEVQKLEIK